MSFTRKDILIIDMEKKGVSALISCFVSFWLWTHLFAIASCCLQQKHPPPNRVYISTLCIPLLIHHTVEQYKKNRKSPSLVVCTPSSYSEEKKKKKEGERFENKRISRNQRTEKPRNRNLTNRHKKG